MATTKDPNTRLHIDQPFFRLGEPDPAIQKEVGERLAVSTA
jgi:putative FmdB family regulatory protein